jgi:hypothetical protein
MVFYHNTAAERGHIARHLAPYADAACKAGQVADLVVRANSNVMADLRETGIVLRESDARECQAKEHKRA